MTKSAMLSILNVAYPFAPVRTDTAGGAEHILARLDRALVDAGHHSTVIASGGSMVAGRLLAIPPIGGVIDAGKRAGAYAAVRKAITGILTLERIDLIHLHGVDFVEYLPPAGVCALITLHLPLSLYPKRALLPDRPGTWLQPVSASQARSGPRLPLLPPIENGVDLPLRQPRGRRGYALAMGRVCREKNFADALDAAREAACPLLLAGHVYGYPEHLHYFRTEVAPRLDRSRRWIGRIAGARKRRLLAGARCVLIPSRIAETSSLVAMEALAAGVPVIAYPAGALPDIVEHGLTGFIVDDTRSMAAAIRASERIDPDQCRRAARDRFCARRMIAEYLALYERLALAGRTCSGTRPQSGTRTCPAAAGGGR